MKRFLALACVGALLAACATGPDSSASVSEGKAIAGAWSTLKLASNSADAAVKAGLLKGSTAAVVADDLRKATASLQAADGLYAANHGADVSSQIADAVALTAAVLNIVSPKPAQ
jgi:hypothetical protein